MIRTGFESYDKLFGGIKDGEVVLLSGLLNAGKSTLAAQVATAFLDHQSFYAYIG